MQNDNHYFIRTHNDNEPLSKGNSKVYPPEIFQFGSVDIELFAYEFEGQWYATEKKTGCKAGQGESMEAAMKDAYRCIEAVGGKDKFIEMIKDTVQRLNTGLEYDYVQKKWDDPTKSELVLEVPTGADE
jgi:hypothetical protein